jgi:hypothetical protein
MSVVDPAFSQTTIVPTVSGIDWPLPLSKSARL